MGDAMPGASLTRADLEGRLLYSLIVAGKRADFANAKTAELLRGRPNDLGPIAWLDSLDRRGELAAHLRRVGVGRYRVMLAAVRWLASAKLDLATVIPEQLEACPGIGPKTARFFVVWTRPLERYAVLDVHVLRWLRARGYQTPAQTPSGRRYQELECAFLGIADRAGVHPRELDLAIWTANATASNEAP